MVLDIGIKGLVQFIEFEAITVFGFFVLLNFEKVMQYFVSGQNVYFKISWSHSCCFYSFRSTTKYLWRNLKIPSYLWIKAWKNVWFVRYICHWCIKLDRWQVENANKPCKKWSSVVLPISITSIRMS